MWETDSYNEDDDPFMKHFDEDGNFIEILPEDESPVSDKENPQNPTINYMYKEEE